MPEEKPRLLTEDEAYAIVAAEIKRETAALTADKESLTKANTDLSTELDKMKVREQAALTQAAEAEKALEDFKAETERRAAEAERKEVRVAKLREVAVSMPEDFYTDEARVQRITAMSDEDFASYCDDMKVVAKPSSDGSGERETAMNNQRVSDDQAESALSKFLKAV